MSFPETQLSCYQLLPSPGPGRDQASQQQCPQNIHPRRGSEQGHNLFWEFQADAKGLPSGGRCLHNLWEGSRSMRSSEFRTHTKAAVPGAGRPCPYNCHLAPRAEEGARTQLQRNTAPWLIRRKKTKGQRVSSASGTRSQSHKTVPNEIILIGIQNPGNTGFWKNGALAFLPLLCKKTPGRGRMGIEGADSHFIFQLKMQKNGLLLHLVPQQIPLFSLSCSLLCLIYMCPWQPLVTQTRSWIRHSGLELLSSVKT